MADISACGNFNCQDRQSCYRYICVWGDMQSFSFYRPNEEGDCPYYMESSPRLRVVTLPEADYRAKEVK